jgi:hypothetical protein
MTNEGKRGFKVRHKQKVASIEPTKPRNFVAKNAINTGAGAHKDKKKAMKQGDTKHKKAYAEGLEEKYQAQLNEFLPVIAAGAGELAAGAAARYGAGKAGQWVAGQAGKAAVNHIGNKVKDKMSNTPDEINEGDSEGAMAKQQLITAAKLAIKLAEQMDSETQLDAWVQTKISLASDYIETVFDFLVHGEQDVDKDVETDEEVNPGITHQHRHGTLKHTATAMEGAKVDRQAMHITKSMMKAHPGMSRDEAEGAAWAHIKHPKKKKKKVKEDAYQIYLDVMLEKSLKK